MKINECSRDARISSNSKLYRTSEDLEIDLIVRRVKGTIVDVHSITHKYEVISNSGKVYNVDFEDSKFKQIAVTSNKKIYIVNIEASEIIVSEDINKQVCKIIKLGKCNEFEMETNDYDILCILVVINELFLTYYKVPESLVKNIRIRGEKA